MPNDNILVIFLGALTYFRPSDRRAGGKVRIRYPKMLVFIAYVLTVLFANICMRLGFIITGLPLAFILVWASVSARTKVAGFVGGLGGVVCVVAFGYGVFRLLVGPDSFTFGVLLASTLPLIIAIHNDIRDLRSIMTARQELLKTMAETHNDQTVCAMEDATATPHASSLAGTTIGLVVAGTWFFFR